MKFLKNVGLISGKFFFLLALENAIAENTKAEEKIANISNSEELNHGHQKNSFHSKSGKEAIEKAEKRRNRRHHEFMNRK